MNEKGLTQRELANSAKLTQGVISKYINGKQEPKSRELYLVSKALGVSMESWFEDSPPSIVKTDSKWKERASELESKLSIVSEALELILQGTEKLRKAVK